MHDSTGTRYDQREASDLASTNAVGMTGGLVNNAAGFVRASTQYLSIADNPSLSMGDADFTLLSNVYIDPSAIGTIIIAIKGDKTNYHQREFCLSYNIATSRFGFRVGNGTSSGYVESNTVAPGTWNSIMAWHDSVNNTVNIQVNDGPVNSVAYSDGGMDSSLPLAVGAYSDGSFGLQGSIDELAIYKRVLSADERDWYYNSGSGRAYQNQAAPANPGTGSLAAWWSMNESGGARRDSQAA